MSGNGSSSGSSAPPLWVWAVLGLLLTVGARHVLHGPGPATPTPTAVAVPWWQWLWLGARPVLEGLGALLLLLPLGWGAQAGIRLAMRRRRMAAMDTQEILLGPDDTATPEEVTAALDAIHTALLTRYGAGALGQVSWAFEIWRLDDGRIHFVLAAPHGWLRTIEDVWRSKYTNLRFRPWTDPPLLWPVAQQIGLTRHWRHPTAIPKTYETSVVETIVQALDRAHGAARLQILLTPLPVAPLAQQLKGALQSLEYEARAAQVADPAHPGLGVVERAGVVNATALIGRSAFRTEIRLGAMEWQTMQAVYGAIAGANADNQWQAHTVTLFRRVWQRWLDRRVPSVALFAAPILFSKPLAALIHVPSARLRVSSLQRVMVRRGPAPLTVPRDPAVAILQDEETGHPVGIPEPDRQFNILLQGSQGSGKSTVMLHVFRVDSHWRDRLGRGKAVFLIDIGKDTAKRAAGIAPPDRPLVWFEPTDPHCPWTINPLQVAGSDDAMVNNLLEVLTLVFGEDAIRSRSREFLGNAILAAKEALGPQADFTTVYQMFTDPEFREHVVSRVRSPHQQAYWRDTFESTLAENPRFATEGLAAPRNKLDEVLRTPLIRAALTAQADRTAIDFRRIIRERQLFVANLDKSKLGTAGARLFGVLCITLLWHALQAQTDLPEAERVPVSLIVDEAQNFLTDGFLDILAEGRAYGAQSTIGVRFLNEIRSERTVEGIRTLVQNLILFQTENRQEAEDYMKRMMRTYANLVSPNDELQDNLNFGADDFLRLPKHYAICRWYVGQQIQPAFLAVTRPWEPLYDEAVRTHHVSRQAALAAAWQRPSGSDASPADASRADASPAASSPTDGAPEDAASADRPYVDPLASDAWDLGVGGQQEAAPPSRPETAKPEPTPAVPEPTPAVPPPGPSALSMPDLLQVVLGREGAEQILAMARDSLTGCWSRAVWDRLVSQAPPGGAGVVYCDLDGLKQRNDRDGHAAGDAYLREAAAALQAAVRQQDFVARVGGDEFAVLLPDMTADRLRTAVARVRAQLQAHGVGASLGAALQAAGEPLAAVIQRADQAMYAEKARHRKAAASASAAATPPPANSRPSPTTASAASETVQPALLQRAVADTGHPEAEWLAVMARWGATPTELNAALRWVMDRRLPPRVWMDRVETVVRLKVEDRVLSPVSQRLGLPMKDLRDWLLAHGLPTLEGGLALHAMTQIRSARDLDRALPELQRRMAAPRPPHGEGGAADAADA